MSRFRKRAPKTLGLTKLNVLNSAKYAYFTIEGSSDDKHIKYVTKVYQVYSCDPRNHDIQIGIWRVSKMEVWG